jgi:uncharacterized protein YndB with AHSA1/START domain
MDRASSTVPAAEPVLTIVRRFDAPRDLVYRMWSEKTFFEQWGCEDSIVVSCEMDLRPEGAWHIAIQMTDGVTHTNGGRYLSVVENEQLAYTEGSGQYDHVLRRGARARHRAGYRAAFRVVVNRAPPD